MTVQDGDGEFAYVWQDDAMQVVYHTATLMPNRYQVYTTVVPFPNNPSIPCHAGGLPQRHPHAEQVPGSVTEPELFALVEPEP